MSSQHHDRSLRQQMVEMAAEQKRRLREGLRVYRPTEGQEKFHLSSCMERLIRGGNRSGKSVAAAMEFASAALGIPITGRNGKPLPHKFPKGALTMWVIGLGLSHIGQTIHRLLFQPGMGGDFKVIWDHASQDYRVWNPAVPADMARVEEAELAEPLIPSRFIDEDTWDWDKKAGNQFHGVKLKNGTKIYAFASTGDLKQGDSVDAVWIDEDIVYPDYYFDWRMRIATRRGRIWWSAFPWSKNDALRDLSDRAAKETEQADPVVSETMLSFSSNPFINAADKEKMFRGLPEEVRLSRDYGDFLDGSVLMYPEFSIARHGMPSKQIDNDRLGELWEKQREFPAHWPRFISIDPGYATTACLFLTIPPPEEYGDVLIVEDELYVRNWAAERTAQGIKAKMKGRKYMAFFIDPHAGKQTTIGQFKNVRAFYTEAMEKVGAKSELTGHSFAYAEPDPRNRWPVVRAALSVRENGTSRLRICHEHCPETCQEFVKYKRRIQQGGKREDIPVDKFNHAMHALEYGMCNHLIRYYEPTHAPTEPQSDGDKILAGFLGKNRRGTISLAAGNHTHSIPRAS